MLDELVLNFQASSGTGAGSFVAPLTCRAYLGKLALLFGCKLYCHSKHV